MARQSKHTLRIAAAAATAAWEKSINVIECYVVVHITAMLFYVIIVVA